MCGRMNGTTEDVIVVDMWKRRECCVKESGRHQQRNNPCFSFLLLLALAVPVSGYCELSMERWWSSAFVTDVLRLRRSAQVRFQAFFAVSFSSNFLFWTCFVWGAKLCMTLLLIYGSRYSDCRSLLRRYATLLSFSASFLFFFFSLSQRSIQVSRCCMDASSTSWFGPAKVSLSSDEPRARREFL